MRTQEVIDGLRGMERRAAGSDAERRAARTLALALRRSGRRGTRVHTFWVRPSHHVVHALILAVAVVASVVAVDHEVVGVALSAGALLALALDLSGRLTVLRRLTFERATQNVVAPDPRGHEHAKVRLILTAAVDSPRRGLLARLPAARLPSRYQVAVAALVVLTAFTALRLGTDDEPSWLGAAQLVPTVLLIAVIALLLDEAASEPQDDPSALAAVLQLATTLDRRPPANLAVDVVLQGAGHAHDLGIRRYIANERRHGTKPTEVAVLHVAACATGSPVYWISDGLVLPLRLHPRLIALAQATGQARPVRSHAGSGARAARGLRWPALAIGARPTTPGPAGDGVEATVEFALALIAALDADLAPTRQQG